MTQLDLYNQALGLIGHDQAIPALPSTSTEAVRCNAAYDSARRAVFAAFDWQWLAVDATITAAAQSGTDYITYIHAKPTGMLRVIDIRDAAGMPLVYKVVAAGIHTDAATVGISYVADNTDPNAWPPSIVDAVAAELAARICIPMGGSAAQATALHQQSAQYMAQESGQKLHYPTRDSATKPAQDAQPEE